MEGGKILDYCNKQIYKQVLEPIQIISLQML